MDNRGQNLWQRFSALHLWDSLFKHFIVDHCLACYYKMIKHTACSCHSQCFLLEKNGNTVELFKMVCSSGQNLNFLTYWTKSPWTVCHCFQSRLHVAKSTHHSKSRCPASLVFLHKLKTLDFALSSGEQHSWAPANFTSSQSTLWQPSWTCGMHSQHS